MTPYDPEGLVLAVPAREVSAPTEAERLLLALLEPVDGAFPRDDARAYLVSRGLLHIENITDLPAVACKACVMGMGDHRDGCTASLQAHLAEAQENGEGM